MGLFSIGPKYSSRQFNNVFRCSDLVTIRITAKGVLSDGCTEITSEGLYKGSVLYRDQREYRGIRFSELENGQYDSIVMEAWCTLQRLFREFPFTMEGFPQLIRSNYPGEISFPYPKACWLDGPEQTLSPNSIFTVVDRYYTFDSKEMQVYYVVEAEGKGRFMVDERIFANSCPNILRRYKNNLDGESIISHLSRRFVGKTFRVIGERSTNNIVMEEL